MFATNNIVMFSMTEAVEMHQSQNLFCFWQLINFVNIQSPT